MNIFKRLFLKDELIGYWSTDDGSGFTINMGSWIRFRDNGTGEYEVWIRDVDEENFCSTNKFKWKRIGLGLISIISEDSKDIEESIEYEIKRFNGRFELTSKQIGSTVSFWNFGQVLLKKI